MHVKIEKHHTRDLRYNNFHRTLDKRLYWMDIDAIEYDGDGEPVVLLELKHHMNSLQEHTFQTKCQIKTANKLGIPAFKITYYPIGFDEIRQVEENPADWGFKFEPLNQLANDVMEKLQLREGKKYNGKEYEQFLLQVRKQ